MQEITIILKNPEGPEKVETVLRHETALGIKERWEGQGEGYTAEIVEGTLEAKAA